LAVSVQLYESGDVDGLGRRLASAGFSVAEAGMQLPGVFPCLAIVSDLPTADATSLAESLTRLGGIGLIQSRSSNASRSSIALIGSPFILKSLVSAEQVSPPMAAEMLRQLESQPQPPPQLLGRGCSLSLDQPRIMGVLNVTPDSFYAGSRQVALDDALRQGVRLAKEGADLIDVGGESTRPGAAAVELAAELERVVPVIERLAREVDCPLSVDTNKSQVAAAAVAAGAEFVNDISGLQFDSKMAETVAQSGAGLFLMHTRGRPRSMQQDTRYNDLLGEIIAYLKAAIDQALTAGISEQRLSIDPGIGFGKSPEGNLEILHRLKEFHCLGRPLLLGTSRKSFIGQALGLDNPSDRLAGTLATVSLGVAAGAQIFRVHDVKPAREAALMAWAICREQMP
jgi:dihydropteroate synthase